MRRLLVTLTTLALALGLVLFAVANREQVFLGFPGLATEVGVPLYLVFFTGLLAGVLLAGLVTLWPRTRRLFHTRRAERRAALAEARLAEIERDSPPATAAAIVAIDRAQEPHPGRTAAARDG